MCVYGFRLWDESMESNGSCPTIWRGFTDSCQEIGLGKAEESIPCVKARDSKLRAVS